MITRLASSSWIRYALFMPGILDSESILYGDLLRNSTSIFDRCPDLKAALRSLHPQTHLLVLIDRSGSAQSDAALTHQQYDLLSTLSGLMEHDDLIGQRLSAFGFCSRETFAIKTVMSALPGYDYFVSRGGGVGTDIGSALEFALDHLIEADHGAILLVSDGIDPSPADTREKMLTLRNAEKPVGLLLQDYLDSESDRLLSATKASDTYRVPTFSLSPLTDNSSLLALGTGYVIDQLSCAQN